MREATKTVATFGAKPTQPTVLSRAQSSPSTAVPCAREVLTMVPFSCVAPWAARSSWFRVQPCSMSTIRLAGAVAAGEAPGVAGVDAAGGRAEVGLLRRQRVVGVVDQRVGAGDLDLGRTHRRRGGEHLAHRLEVVRLRRVDVVEGGQRVGEVGRVHRGRPLLQFRQALPDSCPRTPARGGSRRSRRGCAGRRRGRAPRGSARASRNPSSSGTSRKRTMTRGCANSLMAIS